MLGLLAFQSGTGKGLFGDDASIPKLPDPPALEHYVLESPLGLIAALVAFGVVGMWALGRAGKPRLAWPLMGLSLLLAVGVYIASALVTTTREMLMIQTRELVDAAATGNSDVAGGLLDDGLTFTVLGRPVNATKTRIIEFVRTDMTTRYKLKEHSISSETATIDGGNVPRTQAMAYPNSSWWIIHWRKASDTGLWRVSQIEAQHIQGAQPGFTLGL